MTTNLMLASAFRVIELVHPTLLVDELDSFIKDLPDLVNVLNSGHKKGAYVFRVVGEKQEVRRFATYGPVAYGMIGKPVGTLFSRSILIRMLRKLAEVKTEDFNIEEHAELELEPLIMSQKAIRWSIDHAADVKKVQPETGKFANRQRDNWRALLKLAEVCGGGWPEKVFDAAGVQPPKRKQSNETRVLRDIRNIFHTRNVKQIPSKILVADASRHALGVGKYLATGSGNNQPTGLISAAVSTGNIVTAAGSSTNDGSSNTGANSIGTNDLINTYFKLGKPYRRMAAWYMADSTIQAISLLQDKLGRPILKIEQGLDGPSATLLGRPICCCTSFPAIGAAAFSIVLASVPHVIQRRVPSSAFMRSFRELPGYVEYGIQGFESWIRVDGTLISPNTTYPTAAVLAQHS